MKKEQALLNWGNGIVRSKDKSEAISLPVAVLVNRQTAGAAEALAAVLRETGAGLILGRRTAGQAMVAQEFPLKNGDRLRIATAPIQLGDGSAIVGAGGQAGHCGGGDAGRRAGLSTPMPSGCPARRTCWPGAACRRPTRGGTNRPARRPRFNEADLVRERREGISEADLTALRDREPEKPIVHDPALARALDLLKGLALVRQSRS